MSDKTTIELEDADAAFVVRSDGKHEMFLPEDVPTLLVWLFMAVKYWEQDRDHVEQLVEDFLGEQRQAEGDAAAL